MNATEQKHSVEDFEHLYQRVFARFEGEVEQTAHAGRMPCDDLRVHGVVAMPGKLMSPAENSEA